MKELEDFENTIEQKLKQENEIPAPLLKDSKIFYNNYNINLNYILVTDEYKLYEGESIFEKEKIIIKEYKNEYIEKIAGFNNLINLEYKNLYNCKSKYIIKLKDFYQSKGKILLVFEYYDCILIDIYNQKKFNLEEIRYFLIQINEIIKELLSKQIYDIIFSPENISYKKEEKIDDSHEMFSIKLINLFPYNYINNKFDANSLKYGAPQDLYNENESNFENNISSEDLFSNIQIQNKIDNHSYKYLWNIGVLIYEMYFGEFPYERDTLNNKITFKNFKKSESKEFDDLIINLLQLNYNKEFNWNNYIHHNFFMKIKPEIFYKILYEKEKLKFDINMRGLDLGSSLIYNDNLEILSKIKFKNLIWINLSKNKIEKLDFSNGDAFQNLKFLFIEKNNITKIDSNIKNISIFQNLEFLFLSSNLIQNTKAFVKIEFRNLVYLSLSKNKINNILHLNSFNLKKLVILNLSYNEINDISSLDIINLKELYLNNNKIDDITSFKNFKYLEILNLENNLIKDINIFKEVKFLETIKQLYLNNNPIEQYEELNLSYFPSLKNISLSSMNKKLKILSIKMKLYGYEIDNINSIEKISILLIPFNLSEVLNNDINKYDYKNCFKIITNKNVNEKYLFNYFIEEILEINYKTEDKLINFQIINEDEEESVNNFTNYTIISYFDNKNIIQNEMKSNTLFLINEYEHLYSKYEKYNKIPNYLDKENKSIDINCLLYNINESYYHNTNKIPFISIENNKYILSEFIKYNDYNNRLPLIFINSNYYQNFIDFLKKYPKYQNYKDFIVYDYYLILPWKKEGSQHIIFNNIFLVAEVVENIDFLKYETVIEIISRIKAISQKDYRDEINDWIIMIFDILVEWILFVLNKEPLYYTCIHCKNPLLFIKDNGNNINNNLIHNNSKNNIIMNNNEFINNDSPKYDNSFLKSINICNNIYKIIITNYDKNLMNEYININNLNKEKKQIENLNKFEDEGEQIENYINIIYHDENFDNIKFNQPINKCAYEFQKYTKGIFIFSSSIQMFETIVESINNNNKDNIKFILITNGKSFQTIIDFINSKNITFIKKICIFCKKKKDYQHLLIQYKDILEEIHITENGVINFIKKNSLNEKQIYHTLKLITYNNYISEYYKLHEIISKYYKKTSKKSYFIAIDILKSFLKTNSKTRLLEGLKIFEKNINYEIIREYSNNSIYREINTWLLDLNELAYEKSGYFIGQLMYKLNEYGQNKTNFNFNKTGIYRGMFIDYLDALSYEAHLGKIICFQTFVSSSLDIEIAKKFAKFNLKPEEKKRLNKFSVLIKIYQNFNNESYPLCFDISNIGEGIFKNEKKCLFLPFSFFKLVGYNLDMNNYQLNLVMESICKKEIFEPKIRKGEKIKYDLINNIMKIDGLKEVVPEDIKNEEIPLDDCFII